MPEVCDRQDAGGAKRDVAWIGLGACLAAAYLFPFVRVLFRLGDEGSTVYGAQLVAQGAVPYRDFFVENFGPGSYYLLAAFFKLFGITWVAARLSVLVTGVSTAMLVLWMTRRLCRGARSVLPALMVLLTGIPVWTGSNYHWDSSLFGLLAVAAFFLWQERQRYVFLVGAGVLAGITSCFLQQKGLLVCLGLLAAVPFVCRSQQPRRPVGRPLALLLGGYSLVGVLVLALFYRSGALRDLIQDCVVWPLTTYHGINRVGYAHGFHDTWQTWGVVVHNQLPAIAGDLARVVLLTPILFFLALPVFLIALGAFSRLVPGGPARLFGPRVLPYWTAGAGMWLSELHRPDTFHLIYGAQLLVIVCFYAWVTCFERLDSVRKGGMVFVTASLLVWGTLKIIPPLSASPVATRRGTIYMMRPDDALAFLQREVRSGDETFVYPYYPMYYFLADIRNPTRHTILLYNLHTEQQFRDAIASLEN